MQLTKKQLEFWSILLLVILGASVLILLVDFGIKAAILEESTRLRLKIEEWNGRGNAQTNTGRDVANADDNSSVSVPVLVDESTGMETEHVSNGTAEASATARARRRAQPKGQANDSGIQDGNESVG